MDETNSTTLNLIDFIVLLLSENNNKKLKPHIDIDRINFNARQWFSGDGVRQNYARWERRPHPSNLPCPAPLPSLLMGAHRWGLIFSWLIDGACQKIIDHSHL